MRYWIAVWLLTYAGAAMASSNVSITRDVIYGHKDGMALTYDVFAPGASKGQGQHNGAGIIFMVSGGWMSYWRPADERLPGFASMLEAGFTVFAVHHGSAPRYKVPEAVSDVRAAVRHIKENAATFDVSAEQLGVFGGSAGGHLSLMLGLNPEGQPMAPQADERPSVMSAPNPNYVTAPDVEASVAAVVAYFPPVDLRVWAGPNGPKAQIPAIDFDAELAPAVSPILFVDANDPPVKLIHGDADKLVALENSTSIKTELDKHGVVNDLLILEGAGHGFTGEDRIAAGAALLAWFSEHLLSDELGSN